jgi:hypothetical protein
LSMAVRKGEVGRMRLHRLAVTPLLKALAKSDLHETG